MDETTARAHTPGLERLVRSVRREVTASPDPAAAARAAADHLERALADPDLLADRHLEPGEDSYRQHVLHVEPDGSFSIVCLVWLAGQETPIHDHVAWCVPGVYRGREEETRYRLVGADREDAVAGDPGAGGAGGPSRSEEPYLEVAGTGLNEPGTAVALTPPGDIHRVRNPGPEKAVSVHVYGADIERLGNSIRRTYELPVRAAG